MRRLLVVPLVYAIVTATGMLLQQPTTFYRAILAIGCVSAAASAIVTSNRFTPGDHLHATWIVYGAAYAVAFLRHGYRVWALLGGDDPAPRVILDILLVVQNVLVALALWMFVRTWRTTGLAVPASRQSQIVWTITGIAVGVVVGGYPLLQGFQTAGTNIVLLVSTLGDVIGIALIVPLLMPALAMRGGVLMHTWAYLAASEIAWLMYDLWLAAEPTMKISVPAAKGVEEIFRIVAVACALTASIAQRRAVKPVWRAAADMPLTAHAR